MSVGPRFKNEYGGTFVGRYERLDVWVVHEQIRDRWGSVMRDSGVKIHARPSDDTGKSYNIMAGPKVRGFKTGTGHRYPELAAAWNMAMDYLEDPSVSPNSKAKDG